MTEQETIARLDWLGTQQTNLSRAVVILRRAYKNEVDPDVKQQRFKVLSEAQSSLTRVKQMIAALENEEISLQPPGDDLVTKTEELAAALEQQILADKTVSAQLSLFTKIAKLIAKLA